MKVSVLVTCAAAWLATGSTSMAAQSGYRFVNIIDSTSGLYPTADPVLSMNDHGVVAFYGSRPGESRGIYKSDGGSVITIEEAQTGLFTATFTGHVSINNSGMVAYDRRFGMRGEGGIYVGDGFETRPIVLSGGRLPLLDVYFPDINDAGTVAFYGSRRELGSGTFYGVYSGNGGPVTTIGEGFAFARPIYPDISENGTVAFSAVDRLDSTHKGLYIGNGGPLTQIAGSGQEYTYTTVITSINDGGSVAFTSHDGAEGVSIWQAGEVTTIADTTGTFGNFVGVTINDWGAIAFHAALDNEKVFGIYAGPDPVADVVLREDETLFGSEIYSLSTIPVINNRGDIAFYYTLESGVVGIAVAVPVPEPGARALAAMGLAVAAVGLASRRSR